MVHFVLLIACAATIYPSCAWFVNALTWLGPRLRVGPGATGAVVATLGTAVPQMVVTFVAVWFDPGGRHEEIGVGTAMGGPLLLAVAASAVAGWVMVSSRRKPARISLARIFEGIPADGSQPLPPPAVTGEKADLRGLARDQRWFLAMFVSKVGLGLVAFTVKPWLGLAFFATYVVYVWREIRAEVAHHPGDRPGPLLLQRRRAHPATWAVLAQTAAALVVIFLVSHQLVHQIDAIGPMLGLPAALTALLLSPIATELPQLINAAVWVRRGKPGLALASTSAAMVVQATVPSGLGLLFTPWRLDAALLVCGLVTMLAAGYLIVLQRTNRLALTAG